MCTCVLRSELCSVLCAYVYVCVCVLCSVMCVFVVLCADTAA